MLYTLRTPTKGKAMRVNQKTIPSLVSGLVEFQNSSKTLKAEKNPTFIPTGRLDEDERTKLRIDSEQSGIQYVILSYNTPICWVTKSGWVYKVNQTFTQTTAKHTALLYMLPEGFNRRLVWSSRTN